MKRFFLVGIVSLHFLSCHVESKESRLIYPSIEKIESIESFYLKNEKAIEKKKDQVLKEFNQEFDAFIKSNTQKSKTQDLLQKWDHLLAKITTFMNLCNAMTLVEPNDDLRKVYGKAYLELREVMIDQLASKKELYPFFEALYQKEKSKKNLTSEQFYFLSQTLEDMRLEGLHLTKEKRDQLKEIKKELSELSHAFGENIQEDQSVLWVDRSFLKGLSEDFIKTVQKDEGGLCRIGCDYPTYFTVMKSCQNTELRKDLYRLFMNRAYPKNDEILSKMIAKRDELAKIIGFKSFADYQLSNEMVKNPEAADAFLNELSFKAKGKIDKEIELIKNVFPNIEYSNDGKIYPWDALYVQEKILSQNFKVDEEIVKEYFPLESTLAGLIEIYEKFFQIDIREASHLKLWNEDVKVLTISDRESTKQLGYILLDLFPRKSKYSHACHATIIGGVEVPGLDSTKSLGLVVANFPKPSPDKPSLMYLSDARTFFHEFGHALHAVLGRTQYVSTCGTSVKVDFVELPSQMLEEWLWEPDILKMISSHYQSKAQLPDELIQSILSTRTLNSAAFIGRQCLLSKLSLEIYKEGKEKNINSIMKNLHEETPLFYSYDDLSHFHASFGHLDEYGARYYGYLWSRVLALDLFNHIKEKGLLSSKVGREYREKVLSKGGSQDPSVLLEDFLGRKPSSASFLKAYGL